MFFFNKTPGIFTSQCYLLFITYIKMDLVFFGLAQVLWFIAWKLLANKSISLIIFDDCRGIFNYKCKCHNVIKYYPYVYIILLIISLNYDNVINNKSTIFRGNTTRALNLPIKSEKIDVLVAFWELILLNTSWAFKFWQIYKWYILHLVDYVLFSEAGFLTIFKI